MRRSLVPLAAAGVILGTAAPGVGARVRSVRADPPAARAGALPGDEILVAGGRDIHAEQDLCEALQLGGRGKSMAIAVRRDGGIKS